MTTASIPPPPPELALSAYMEGLFPMDDLGRQHEPLPWYTADPRAIFELGEEPLALTRRAVRRSLAKAANDWELRVCRASDRVITACAQPRPRDGVWLTPRLCSLYRALDGVGALRTFELWVDGRLAAGIVGVGVGRAVMLESMFHTVPDSGNVLIYRTLEHLHASGCELCDVQMATDHTRRLGVIEIPAAEYSARLAHALAAR